MKKMVNGHDRYLASDQFLNLRIVKINAGDHHAVKPPVSAVLEIGHSSGTLFTAVDKCDIISIFLHRILKAVQHIRKIVVGKPAHGLIRKKHPQIIGSVCL